ncbi:MAG: hypothetical protein JWN02_1726, partial [Acidobacteria bacterium]|nr:hypothetical protein [Acidobacteriota bacterium]
MTRLRFGVLILLLATSSAFAASRPRTSTTLPDVAFNGFIKDFVTLKPVIGAEVSSGNRITKTDGNGAFVLLLQAGRLTAINISRTGYQPLTYSVTPLPAETGSGGVVVSPPVGGGGTGLPPVFSITPRPTVAIHLTNGTSLTLDSDSVQFGYVLPFANPETSEQPNFCTSDGIPFTPEPEEMAKIVGPAHSITSAPCCKLGPVLAVKVEMKSGETFDVAFADSCFGYDVTLVGREHDNAQYQYLKFTEISEI